ncbi:hypothetical protein A2U01_0118214 [Trifolium medium]|uniref:Uncharacterized protein n=1 Tax=Trifolium medium TaxID=97028 RepID=A0A392W8F3_9FABA|nr:hypothetical protein [Trifolium medium]
MMIGGVMMGELVELVVKELSVEFGKMIFVSMTGSQGD